MAERQAGHFRRVATTAEHRSGSRTPADDAFLLLFAHNPLPMWVFDDETLMFLEVNNAAVEHYGYSRDEFLTMRITDIRLPEDLGRLEAYRAAPRPELRDAGVWRHRCKNGTIIDVEVHSHALQFAVRRPSRFLRRFPPV